jgi:dTDP-4-dehydrorhamnose 3,5-epimerase
LRFSRKKRTLNPRREADVRVIETALPGVLIIESPVFRDGRGYFEELYRRDALQASGIDLDWKQDNFSVSARNVVRGLHYQIVQPQAKLVQAVCGAVFDVAVDIRRSSPTFGRHVAVELHAGDGRAFFIPAGFAHGFLSMEANTAFLYKVSEFYAPQGDRTILWNDPELAIPWPVSAGDAIVSEKDRRGGFFKEVEVFP